MTIGMSDNDGFPTIRDTYRNESALIAGMIGIMKCRRQRIAEHGRGFIKAYSMFIYVFRCLPAVPFKLQGHLAVSSESDTFALQ